MRAVATNLLQNNIHCPFCRAKAENISGLIVCSDCKTFYHRECWDQNRGCSVYGCTGMLYALNVGNHSKNRGEPNWLIALRVLVFGFIPFISIWVVTVTCLKSMLSDFMGAIFVLWGFGFVLGAPLLLISEIICLYRVYKQPELQSKYGDRDWHILSLSVYCIVFAAIFFLIVLLTCN